METVVRSESALDFEQYVAVKRPALMRAARAITHDHNSAEDLLQTALANVFPRWSSIRDHAAADAYVRRAMINQRNSWLRQRWRTNEHATDPMPELADAGTATRSVGPDPDLWALVSSLPPRQRSVVVLRYYEDLSEAETAKILQIAQGTVKWTTHRGLATLRRLAGEAAETTQRTRRRPAPEPAPATAPREATR